MALLQFAKLFDRDSRTVSIRNLLLVAKEHPTVLVPFASAEELITIEDKINRWEQLLNRLKTYRDQRLAHHDQQVSRDTALPFGEVRQLVDDIKNIFNSLSSWHDHSTVLFERIHRDAEWHTKCVKQIMREEKDRAEIRIRDAENQTRNW
jgi:hypothetical protein